MLTRLSMWQPECRLMGCVFAVEEQEAGVPGGVG